MWLHARLVWMSWIEGRHCGTCSRRDQWSCVSNNVSCIHQYSPLSSSFVWSVNVSVHGCVWWCKWDPVSNVELHMWLYSNCLQEEAATQHIYTPKHTGQVSKLQCHMWLYSNSLHASSTLWHTYSTCKHTDRDTVSTCKPVYTPPTKLRGRSSHSTPHLGRQAGSQHVFITGLVILPKVQTNGLCQLSLEWVSHLKWGRSARMTVHRYYRNLSIDSLH